MKCPVCENTELLLSERNGVEIDYCPNCRGIWLDRAELDKIIERSNTYEQKEQSYNNEKKYNTTNPKKRKKESFISDIFDMF